MRSIKEEKKDTAPEIAPQGETPHCRENRTEAGGGTAQATATESNAVKTEATGTAGSNATPTGTAEAPVKLETKRFRKNDNGFVCRNCGKEVLPLGYTSRNHCPFCLCSLHVDNLPGDRANPCKGLLVPFRAEPDTKKGGYILYHRCQKCGQVVRNRAATDAKIQPDDIDLVIALTAGEYKFKK